MKSMLKWKPGRAHQVPDNVVRGAMAPVVFKPPVTGVLTDPEVIIPKFRDFFRNRPYRLFRKLFTRFDTDGNGTISQEELAQGLRDIYPGITDVQAAGIFQAITAYVPGDPPPRRVPGGKRHGHAASAPDPSDRVSWWPSYVQEEEAAARAGKGKGKGKGGGKRSGKRRVRRGSGGSDVPWPPVAPSDSSAQRQGGQGDGTTPASQAGAKTPATQTPTSAGTGSGSGTSAGGEITLNHFFEFLMDRKSAGDVFDPWTVEYDR